MKGIIWFSRIAVGALFIFSGLIKANDALGFSYKLEEYFEKFSEIFSEAGIGILSYPMDWMVPIALPLSMFIVVFEIVLGVRTLLGIKMEKTAKWLLILIVFFTLLTFVSWAFDIVKSCGCFGDAIPLTPFESFMKDVVLLVLIGILFLFRKNINSIMTPVGDKLATGTSWIVFGLFTFYCYQHLPFKDFRAYAPGKHLLPQMEVVKGNPLNLYHFKHKTKGTEIFMGDYPDDWENWDYIDFQEVNGELDVKFIEIQSTGQKTKVIEIPNDFAQDWKILKDTTIYFEPNKDPKIQQLSAEDYNDADVNYLPEMLQYEGQYFWLILRGVDDFGTFTNTEQGLTFEANRDGEDFFERVNTFTKQANNANIKVYALCSEGDPQKVEAFRHGMQTAFPFYSTDDTELKTMIRSSPGLLFLQGDSVVNKWHKNDFPQFEDINNEYLNQ